jgi:rhodanese-related sulfurtransferase
MGNSQSIQKINYEDIQYITQNQGGVILINVLNASEQDCLIPNTISINSEIEVINNCIKTHRKDIKIIIYGRNCNDEKTYEKYNQLSSLGFYNIYIYPGGIFEWLMLQDIYGKHEFPTTKNELDILRFKPRKMLNIQLLEY